MKKTCLYVIIYYNLMHGLIILKIMKKFGINIENQRKKEMGAGYGYSGSTAC